PFIGLLVCPLLGTGEDSASGRFGAQLRRPAIALCCRPSDNSCRDLSIYHEARYHRTIGPMVLAASCQPWVTNRHSKSIPSKCNFVCPPSTPVTSSLCNRDPKLGDTYPAFNFRS